jgi:hypothetical protein
LFKNEYFDSFEKEGRYQYLKKNIWQLLDKSKFNFGIFDIKKYNLMFKKTN